MDLVNKTLVSNSFIKEDIGSFEELEKAAAAKPHYIEEPADYNPFDLDQFGFSVNLSNRREITLN